MVDALSFQCGTLNARGLCNKNCRGQLLHLMCGWMLGVLAIQETKIESDERTAEALDLFQSDYEVCVSNAKGFSAG